MTQILKQDTISYQGFFLALITALASGLLLVVYQLSAPTIALQKTKDQLDGLNQVLPSEWVNPELIENKTTLVFGDDEFVVFPVTDALGQAQGYAVQSNADGFSGEILILVGTDADLKITGVRVLAHAETPGLGDKIEIAKSNWIRSFEHSALASLTESQWAVKKDGGQFDQFTGATITPRAIVKQVYQTLNMLENAKLGSASHD